MTDNEIKKALECLEANTNCSDCALYDKKECKGECVFTNTLDLINRLQEDKQNLEVELQAMRGAANSYKAENKRLSTLAELGEIRANDYRVMRDRALEAEAENERLKNAYKQCAYERDVFLRENPVEMALLIDEQAEQLKTAKAEAYKEFAEKAIELIKTKAFNLKLMRSLYTSQSAKALERVAEDIDNLLKEMVGEDNG